MQEFTFSRISVPGAARLAACVCAAALVFSVRASAPAQETVLQPHLEQEVSDPSHSVDEPSAGDLVGEPEAALEAVAEPGEPAQESDTIPAAETSRVAIEDPELAALEEQLSVFESDALGWPLRPVAAAEALGVEPQEPSVARRLRSNVERELRALQSDARRQNRYLQRALDRDDDAEVIRALRRDVAHVELRVQIAEAKVAFLSLSSDGLERVIAVAAAQKAIIGANLAGALRAAIARAELSALRGADLIEATRLVALQRLLAGESIEANIQTMVGADPTVETERDERIAALEAEVVAAEEAVASAVAGPVSTSAALELRGEVLTGRAAVRAATLEYLMAFRSGTLTGEGPDEEDSEADSLADELASADAAAATAQAEADEAERRRAIALQQAEAARSEALRRLAETRAAAESARAAIAVRSRKLATARRTAAEQAGQFHLAMTVATEVIEGDGDGKGALHFRERLATELALIRRRLRIALAESRAPSRVPDWQPDIDFSDPQYSVYAEERNAALLMVEALRRPRAELQEAESDFRRDRIANLAAQADAATRLRAELIPYLEPADRERALAFGQTGRAEFAGEVSHLGAMARWWIWDRMHGRERLSRWAASLFGPSKRGSLLAFLALLIAGRTLFRRRDDLTEYTLKRAKKRSQRGYLRPQTRRLVTLLTRTTIDIVLAIVAAVTAQNLYRFAPAPGVRLIGSLCVGAVITWLSIRGVHRVLVEAVTSPRRAMDDTLSARILRTVRLIGLFALGAWATLFVIDFVMGRGYLYLNARRLCWVLGVATVLLAINHWREDVFLQYTQTWESSRISRLAARWNDRPRRMLLALPATARVAGRGLWSWFSSIALRYDRTRQALAYLFRRSLDKQSARLGAGTQDVRDLPVGVRDAFYLPEINSAVRVETFPKIANTMHAIRRWVKGDPGISFAVVAEHSVGKSTWLRELDLRVDEVDFDFITIDDKCTDVAELCRHLGGKLADEDQDGEVETVDEVVSLINDGIPRIIIVDQAHNLVLRAPHGVDAYEAFARIVRRTTGTVCWGAAFSQNVWRYLDFALGERNVFQSKWFLQHWSEAEIKQLIEKRMSLAGYTWCFEEMLSRSTDRNLNPRERADELWVLETNFFRHLWDYTEGVPGLALHFWLRSLVPKNDTELSVRPFHAPAVGDLEALGEAPRLLLGAVAMHDWLSVAQAARVLQYPEEECLSIMRGLRQRGFLTDWKGRYRVTDTWNRAVMGYLRRKHLLRR